MNIGWFIGGDHKAIDGGPGPDTNKPCEASQGLRGVSGNNFD